jgi:pyridoxal phosphate enzyme (YggS family)
MNDLRDDLACRLAEQRKRLHDAARRAGRAPDEVCLIAVSKKQPLDSVRVFHALGVRDFGENYVQDWERRREVLPADIRWHFIGALQSNKARRVAGRVALLHTVDRPSLLASLPHDPAAPPQDVLLQVNVGREPQKAGCDPDALSALLAACLRTPGVRPCGLMTVPPVVEEPEQARPCFAALRARFEALREELRRTDPAAAAAWVHLSMGMSDDAEVAVEEGATLVRVGTALFGPRFSGAP